MMHFPEELVEKTKKLFPEASNLHEAIETRDMMLIMNRLNEMAIPITNIINEWYAASMKHAFVKNENMVDNSSHLSNESFKAA